MPRPLVANGQKRPLLRNANQLGGINDKFLRDVDENTTLPSNAKEVSQEDVANKIS
jgi:hypothetical protein